MAARTETQVTVEQGQERMKIDDDEELDGFSRFLIVVSYILVFLTFPITVFFCLKVILEILHFFMEFT